MITHTENKIKSLSQKSYDDFLEDIPFHKLLCSCGKVGHLIKHAYYTRTVKTPDSPVSIRILRVICKRCGKTHAIFPQVIVPYSQILINDHIDIIKTYIANRSFEPIMMANEYIDESNIRYIIRQFLRHWKERIDAFHISINETFSNIIIPCLEIFKKQFMQIKCTPNILSA